MVFGCGRAASELTECKKRDRIISGTGRERTQTLRGKVLPAPGVILNRPNRVINSTGFFRVAARCAASRFHASVGSTRKIMELWRCRPAWATRPVINRLAPALFLTTHGRYTT